MPEMGGLSFVETLKEKEMPVPVIILTGHPLNNDLQNLATDGWSIHWIQKPISLPKLAQSVADALQ